MSEPRRCLACGVEIRPNSPSGMCPRCLLEAGVESHAPASSGHEATQASPASGSAPFVPPTPADLARYFPQLEVLELLGVGGMGAVYKARQPGLDRFVAIKIMSPQVSHDPAFAERFAREARALARLSHPHIVSVYDFGQAEGLYYFVMDYVDGLNLRQTIQAGRLSPTVALSIVSQVCEALQFAHDEGVVHRDIKPENILIDKKGRVKIADFGLAKLTASGGRESPGHLESLTGTQQVMGTLRYMAPEQMEGSHDVDHRADIYSLGVVFYELLTGELPIGRFAPPSKKVQIDVRLDEVVLRALEKEPELRYQQASELKTSVESMGVPASTAGGAPLQFGSHSAAKPGRGRMYWRTLGWSALAWWLVPLLWNARQMGLLVACVAIGAVVVWLARRAGPSLPETQAQWAKAGKLTKCFNVVAGVGFTAIGVYLMVIGLSQAWERFCWSVGAKTDEEFVQTYQGVEHRLLQQLTAYKNDVPRAELLQAGGRWSGGWSLGTSTSPNIRFYQPFTFVASFLLGAMMIWGTYLVLLSTAPKPWLWAGWGCYGWPSLGLSCATVLPLLPYAFLLWIVSLTSNMMSGSFESQSVRTAVDLKTIVARMNSWADGHGYAEGDFATFMINEVPGGKTLAKADIRQMWRPDMFDRWHMTLRGLRRVSPHLVLQMVSDEKAKETVVRLTMSANGKGSPENAPLIEAYSSLLAALEQKPVTPAAE